MPKSDPSDLTSLLQARQQRKTKQPVQKQLPDAATAQKPSSPEPPKKVGRPKGRRSNPDVSPLNLLINQDLILEVRFKLGKLNKGKSPKTTISDLVEDLLQEWVNSPESESE